MKMKMTSRRLSMLGISINMKEKRMRRKCEDKRRREEKNRRKMNMIH